MVSLSLYFKWDWALCILLLKDPREKGHTERQGRNQTENSHRKSVKRFTVLWLPAVCCPLWTCSADWREHMAIPVHPWKAMQCSLNHLPLQIKLSHQTLSWCGWGVFTRVIPQGVSGGAAIINPGWEVWYGISSNSFVKHKPKPSFTSVLDAGCVPTTYWLYRRVGQTVKQRQEKGGCRPLPICLRC